MCEDDALTNVNGAVTLFSMNTKAIGYIRVSTHKQGKSGLGLEAQRAAIHQHASEKHLTLSRIYQDVESGTKSDRPELAKALSHAKQDNSLLIIAKLDRLARNVALVATIMESKVDFVCCDQPFANKLTLHILSAMAEFEADQASTRTKAALAAAKARGVKLGSSRPGHWDDPRRSQARRAGLQKAVARAASLRTVKAREAILHVIDAIRELRSEGLSYRAVASKLNEMKLTTRQGNAWHAAQVIRVLRRSQPEQVDAQKMSSSTTLTGVTV